MTLPDDIADQLDEPRYESIGPKRIKPVKARRWMRRWMKWLCPPDVKVMGRL